MHQVMSLPCYYYCPHYWTAVPFIWLLIFQFPQLSLQLGDLLADEPYSVDAQALTTDI